MAGHSHSANIKHRKNAVDAKRGKLFGKLSRAIIIAAKNGGGDPDANLKLRYAIDKARQNSMPKDNIERAIKKGIGELEGESFEEVTYEGYGAGGVGILVETATDNRNRTNGEIRKIFEKGGGRIGTPNSVAFQFDRKGLILVATEKADEETLMMTALDAGAEDMKKEGDYFEIYCDPSTFSQVTAALESENIEMYNSEITQIAQNPVEVDAETARKVLKLMDALDEHDDSQAVFSTANIPDEILEEINAEE